MAKKEVVKKLKLVIPGGQAVPGQKLGPALGQAGIPIGDFVKRFNDATADMKGDMIPAEISVYADRSFDFVLKTPPASSLLFKAAGIEGGSGKNNQKKAGKVTMAQVRAIAEKKLPDLNAHDVEAAMKIILGSARSAGIEVVG
jgi:large subunit ribosomal protein L11